MTDSLLNTSHTMVPLKDCCEEIAQRIDNPADSGFERFVGLEHLETGETSIRNWGSTEDVTSSMKLFKTGDAIVARRNVYLRRAAHAHFDGVCSGDGIVLRANPKVCLPDLLPFLLNTDAFWAYVTSQADGTMSKRITVKRLLSYELALPPLEEQRRIAEVLQAAQRFRNRFVGAEDKLAQVRRSILTRAFTTDLTDISEWPTLESLCSRIGDGTHLPPPFTETGIPFLLVSNLKGCEIDWNTEKFVSEESYRELTKTWRPQQGDLLYSLVGSFGVPARIETEERFTFQRHIGLIRTDPDELLADYLYWYLRSPAGYRQAMWRAEGLAQKTITLGALRAFRIPWRPMPEQQVCVEQFENIEAKRAELSMKESEIGRLTAGLISSQLGGHNQ